MRCLVLASECQNPDGPQGLTLELLAQKIDQLPAFDGLSTVIANASRQAEFKGELPEKFGKRIAYP
jgi:hypothetical protein